MDENSEPKPKQWRAWILLWLVPLPVLDGDMRNIFGCAILFFVALVYAVAYNFLWSRRDSELRLMFDSALIASLGFLPPLLPSLF